MWWTKIINSLRLKISLVIIKSQKRKFMFGAVTQPADARAPYSQLIAEYASVNN